MPQCNPDFTIFFQRDYIIESGETRQNKAEKYYTFRHIMKYHLQPRVRNNTNHWEGNEGLYNIWHAAEKCRT